MSKEVELVIQAREFFNEAEALYTDKKFNAAKSKFMKSSQLFERYDPTHKLYIKALRRIALIYFEIDLRSEGVRYLERMCTVMEAQNGVTDTLARTLGDVGSFLFDRGYTREAKQFYSRAKRLYEELMPTDAMLLKIYFEVGLINSRHNEPERALEYLQKAQDFYLAHCESMKNIIIANIVCNKGMILVNQGKLPQALSEFHEGARLAEELGENATLGTVYSNIGLVHRYQGEFTQADEFYSKALELQETNLDTYMPVATTCSNIGIVKMCLGQSTQAMESFKKALGIVKLEAPGSPSMAKIYNNIGMLLNWREAHQEALKYFYQALDIHEKLHVEDSDLATLYSNLGLTHYELEELDKAAKYYRKALVIDERLNAESLIIASTYNNLGCLQEKIEDFEGAMDLFMKSKTIKETLAPNSLSLAVTYSNLGAVFDSRADLERSITYYRKAVKIFTDIAPHSTDLAKVFCNLAIVLRSSGQSNDALEYLNEAVKVHANDKYGKKLMAQTYRTMSEIAEEQGNTALATDYREKAVNASERDSRFGLTPFVFSQRNSVTGQTIGFFTSPSKRTSIQSTG